MGKLTVNVHQDPITRRWIVTVIIDDEASGTTEFVDYFDAIAYADMKRRRPLESAK